MFGSVCTLYVSSYNKSASSAMFYECIPLDVCIDIIKMWFTISVTLWWCLIWRCESLLFPIVDIHRVYKYTPPEDQVTFHLYHYSDLSKDDKLFIDDRESISGSRFNPHLETKILIHGWTHGKDVPWVVEMREAMAKTRQWNIIVVDWAPLSHVIYIEARIHTPVVSKQVAQFLLSLKRYAGLSMSSVHIIGHSMGAQIAAYSSLKVRQITLDQIGRITGLDPAAPLFEWPHVEYLDEVLDPTDAEFVDVIHTNGRYLGMITPAGHVDYYPNGGEHQPGCVFWICSHLRAAEYWIASIKNSSLFRAFPYNSWNEYQEGHSKYLPAYPMGILANKQIPSGTYFLETGNEFRKYVTSVTTIENSYI